MPPTVCSAEFACLSIWFLIIYSVIAIDVLEPHQREPDSMPSSFHVLLGEKSFIYKKTLTSVLFIDVITKESNY